MNASFAPSPTVPRDARVALTLALVAMAALYLPTLRGFHDVWVEQPYTHGYLVLAAVVWLAWRDRRRAAPDGGVWQGALPLAAGLSFAWLAAHVTGVRVLELAVLPPMLVLWVAASLGRATALRLAPLAAILLLAVPVWEVLTPPLQALTVAVAGNAVSLFGVPATLEGNAVTIPSGTFLIEGGCAGLNYFMAALVLSTIYGQAFLRVWQARLAAVAFLVGMSVVGNWLRVSSLIAIGHATDMQSGLMEDHLLYGWVIFAAAILASIPAARRLEAWEARRWPSARAAALAASDAGAPGPLRARVVALGTLAVLMGPICYFVVDSLPARAVPPNAVVASDRWLADERGARPFSWRPDFQGADQELQTLFASRTELVLLDRFVYRSQDQDGELVGFSSRIAPDGAVIHERLIGQIGPERRVVNEAIVRDGPSHVLVWYWYRVAGIETPSAVRAKVLELWAFFTRSTTSELIAISAACSLGDCSTAARALSSFLGA